MGIQMMKADIKDGNKRLKRHEASANLEIVNILQEPFEWESLPSLTKTITDQRNIDRIIGIRNDYATAIERNNQILDRFPEKYLSGFGTSANKNQFSTPMKTLQVIQRIIKVRCQNGYHLEAASWLF